MKMTKDELYIITNEELEDLKNYAIKMMEVLPTEERTALLAVSFLKELMEQSMGKKVKGIKVCKL